MSNFAPSTTYAPNADSFGSYEYTAPQQDTDPFGQNALYGNGGNAGSFDQGTSFPSNPFEPAQGSYDAAPAYQSGYQQTDPFAQNNFAPNSYTESFAANDPFGQGFGLEQPSQREATMDARPPLSERLKEKIGTVLNVGGRAVRSMMSLMEGNKFASQAAGRAEQMSQMYNMAGNAQQAYGNVGQGFNTVRQDANAAWDNRAQYGRQAANFVGNAAMETGKAGLAGAGEYAMNRYGLQRDREARFGITVANKRALARGVMRTAINPQAEAARLAHGAFNAGRREATASARGQMAAARSNARGAAANYARGIF
jgi:hypothetical protein